MIKDVIIHEKMSVVHRSCALIIFIVTRGRIRSSSAEVNEWLQAESSRVLRHMRHDGSVSEYSYLVSFFLSVGIYLVLGHKLDEKQWFTLRLALALSAAGIAAFLPGSIGITVKSYVKAGGALAVFYVVYAVNPPNIEKVESKPQPLEASVQPEIKPDAPVTAKPAAATHVVERSCTGLEGTWYEHDKRTGTFDGNTWDWPSRRNPFD